MTFAVLPWRAAEGSKELSGPGACALAEVRRLVDEVAGLALC